MLESSQVNAVLVAESFNLNIFQPLWLIDNEIITRTEIESGTSFNTPVAVSISTDTFDLLIIPERIQLSLKNDEDNAKDNIKRIIGGIVNKLPHTPYSAIGLNFNYTLTSNNQDSFVRKTKELFMTDTNPLASEFNTDDVRVGIYASKDIFGSRLRVDVKPIINKDRNEAVQVNCNIHRNVTSATEIEDIISNISKMNEYTNNLTNILNKALEE